MQAIWEIDSVFDVDYRDGELRKTLVDGRSTATYDERIAEMIADAKSECGYDIAEGNRFFCGQPYETEYVKTSPGGIQGARFVNLREVLGDFYDAEGVATGCAARYGNSMRSTV